MSIRPCDELGLDLFETQTVFGISLNYQVAENLIEEVERRERRRFPYRTARRQALEAWGIHDYEWQPWEALLNRVFNRRRSDTKTWLNRPFAPLHAHEDGH